MGAPVIGITMSREEATDKKNYSRDWLRSTYVVAVSTAGGIPVALPNEGTSVTAVQKLHGLLLTGGPDFHPGLFGQADEGTQWEGWSRARDETELQLIRAARALGMPIFGICRGAQALAVAGGGTLVQDIRRRWPDTPIEHSQKRPRTETTHAVSIVPGTRLGAILGESRFSVNSYHHQAVDRLPEGWQVAARADDGVIEAIESAEASFAIGVQWHPEDLVDNEATARALFSAFVSAARRYQERGGGRG